MRTITLKEMKEKFGIEFFDFEYDFKEKERFEKHFKDWYWFRNIGFETTDMFLHWLRVEVERKSAYYNRLIDVYKDLEVELYRGHEQIIDHKGKAEGLRELAGTDQVLNESTDKLISEMEKTINDTVQQLRTLTGETSNENTTQSSAETLSETLDKMEELGKSIDFVFNSSVPYEQEKDLVNNLRSVDSVVKNTNEANKEGTSSGKTEGSTTTTGSDTSKTTSNDTDDNKTTTEGTVKDAGTNDRTIKGQTDTTKSEKVNDEKIDEYITRISNVAIPLSEAIEELEKVKLDVVHKFVVSLNDLFALVY